MTGTVDRFWTVFVRELRDAVRTRTYLLLLLGTLVVVVGLARAGDGPSGGYVPTVVDVLLVVELLVPAIAFAVGYRAITDASLRGELDVLRTYPLSAWAYVGGVFAGRAATLLGIVGVPLAVLGLHVATTAGPATTVFASHRGVDSALLYVRFLALTAIFALVTLAIALALSAVADSRRRAILLGLVGLLFISVGADVAVFTMLGSGLSGGEELGGLLAMTPAGAYRGLVFETVLYVAFEGRAGFVSVPVAVLSLLFWGGISVAVTTLAVDLR